MRVGFVTDVYKPYVSGVTHCVSLNRFYLEEQGHETYVFSFADPRSKPVEHQVIHSPGFKWVGTAEYRVGPRLTREARRVLATMDVVNVDNPFVSGRLALNACVKTGVPVVFTNHTRVDLYAAYYANVAPALLRDTYVRSYVRKFCRAVDAVVSPTESMERVLRGMGVDVDVEVVPNGVDIGRFLAIPRGFSAATRVHAVERAKNGYSEKDVVFVYSGRLGPEKNLPLLVESFVIAARELPRAKFLFIGGGQLKKKTANAVAKAGIADRTTFTGMVPYESIPYYLSLADVWCSASVTEVHPLTVIEAMACGLPIVGVISPGVSDTVEHRRTGLLAVHPEATGIADCLISMATDHDARHAMAVAAREESKRYAIESTGAQMLGMYETLAREAAGRAPSSPVPRLRVPALTLSAIAAEKARTRKLSR